MPYGWIDPEVFLGHNGVTVYHVYKDNEISQGIRLFWYTTDLYGGDCDDPFSFDVRDLAAYAPDKPHEEIVREAIDAGYEKLRYLTAYSCIITVNGFATVSLEDASIQKAQELLCNPRWDTVMEY